ncbi:hypothetical protein CTAYLR_005449 [Chrysophaeum taylorii]|uniref:Uncharacterized protein n=1 Tax=Chrysophaeum taylorii TaxID=2483200 RepID=A0AAD7ULJ0_9STRA|nr:hypothetical protein CTAYLR_005449 [Chrysophaeum taylorii]
MRLAWFFGYSSALVLNPSASPRRTAQMSAATYSIADQQARFARAKEEKNERFLDITTVFDGEYLRDKRVVVTGGNRGLGLEIVKRAKECGAEVIVTCRAGAADVEGLATAYEGVDVTNLQSLTDFAKRVVEEKGPIDVLINNAGYFYGPQEKVIEGTLNFDEQWKQIDICALGPLRVTSELFNAGGLKEGSKAVIITSQAGSVEWRFTQNPEGGDYGHHMSRAACNIMGALLSQELKSKGITVLLLHPGFNKTTMTKKYEHIWEIEGAVEPSQGAMRVLHEVGAHGIEDSGKFFNCEDGLQIPW